MEVAELKRLLLDNQKVIIKDFLLNDLYFKGIVDDIPFEVQELTVEEIYSSTNYLTIKVSHL